MKITLKNLAEATEQQVFDQVAVHLLTQKGQCVDGSGCAYRGVVAEKSGAAGMCAAGCLIGDDEYKANKFERKNWVTLIELGKVPGAHRTLISKLQELHDCMLPQYWKSELFKLAEDRGLNINAIEDL